MYSNKQYVPPPTIEAGTTDLYNILYETAARVDVEHAFEAIAFKLPACTCHTYSAD